MVSDMRKESLLLVPGFGRLVLLCRSRIPRDRGIADYVRDGYGAFCPTLACGGTLALLMTDVPDLLRVAVLALLCNADHSSLSAAILMTQGCSKLIC